MGASSVTGVSGYGTVAGIQKGSEHMSLGVEKLIGPRHVYTGLVNLSAANPGIATIYVNLPTSAVTDYVVTVQDQARTTATPPVTADSAAVVIKEFTIDSTTNEAKISLSGTTSHVVAVAIEKVGFAGAFLADASH